MFFCRNKKTISLDKHLAYGKCPKISYTKVSGKIAYGNSADPDQTALSVFAIPLSILRNYCIKKQNLGK